MKWQWKVHFIRPTVANPLINLFAPSEQSDYIEGRRHETSRQGVLGVLPQFFFLILGASMCVFNGFFMHLEQDFSPFGHDLLLEKIFLVTRETKCWTKLFLDSHDFFTFFSTACFFDTISPMYLQVLEGTFNTDHWSSFKELCFRKDIHLVFSITCRTSVKDAGFI